MLFSPEECAREVVEVVPLIMRALVGGLMSLAAAGIVLRFMPETVERRAIFPQKRSKGKEKG